MWTKKWLQPEEECPCGQGCKEIEVQSQGDIKAFLAWTGQKIDDVNNGRIPVLTMLLPLTSLALVCKGDLDALFFEEVAPEGFGLWVFEGDLQGRCCQDADERVEGTFRPFSRKELASWSNGTFKVGEG